VARNETIWCMGVKIKSSSKGHRQPPCHKKRRKEPPFKHRSGVERIVGRANDFFPKKSKRKGGEPFARHQEEEKKKPATQMFEMPVQDQGFVAL